MMLPMTITVFILFVLVAFIAGLLIGIWHTQDSICRTIERFGYRIIDGSRRIVGEVQKGTFE